MRRFSSFLSDSVFGRSSISEPAQEEQVAKGKDVLLGDRIDELGFGAYQLHILILCSGFIFAEGAEVQMAAGLVNAMQDEFNIYTKTGQALLMICTFVGFTLGSLASGPIGDSLGRRSPLIWGYLGVIATGFCTTLVGDLSSLYIARLTLGFFAGIGIPTACIVVSECTPSTLRGKVTAAMGISYCLGELWASIGLSLLMPDLIHGSWRSLILWALIPAGCLSIFGMISPVTRNDTPFFLGCHGKTKELREVLDLVAEMNGKPHLKLAEKDTVICHVPDKISFYDALPTLFRRPMVFNVLVLCFICFAKDFAFYGTDVFWPQVWAQFGGDGLLSPAAQLMATAMIGIPGFCLATFTMNILPRKVGIASCSAACGIAVLLVRGLPTGGPFGYFGVVIFKLLFPTWQMTAMLLPSEIFGTQIRGWGFAVVATCGRFATIICPLAVALGINTFTAILFLLSVGTVLIVSVLPETKDCELTEDAINSAPSTRKLVKDCESETYGAAGNSKV